MVVKNKRIQDCGVSLEDAKRALHLYGPSVVTLKGRSVRRRSHRINKSTPIKLPKKILPTHRDVYLYADYMFVQGVPSLTTISGEYRFRTVEPFFGKYEANLGDILTGLQQVINLYHSHGLRVVQIAVNNKFGCVREHIWPVMLNTLAAEEHVNEVVR